MENLFIITATHGSHLYSLFYIAAFLVATGIFIFQGMRNHYPIRTWFLITLFGILGFIIGNKAITVGIQGWFQFFNSQALSESGRSVLGGILGLTAGLLIAQRWLKFNRPVIDHLAYALPAGIAVTRLGCLFGGCCFGTPTSLLWGIQYGASSHAFHTQVDHLQIPAASALSLPVHPTQVYDILFCLAILLLVYLIHNRWKNSGSRFLFVVLCYAGFRFVEEFFRESTRTGLPDQPILGVKLIQWLLLGAVGILAIILIVRERRGRSVLLHIKKTDNPGLYREFILFCTIPAFLVVAHSWLDPFEKLTLWISMVPLLADYLLHLYSRMTVPALRRIMPFIFLIAMVTMSQDTINQKTGTVNPGYKGWWSVEAFGSIGKYEDRIYDCDGNIEKKFDRNYSTWGAGAAYHFKPLEYHHLTVGLNAYSATDRTDEADEWDYKSPALNAFISYDLRYAGARLGMNVFFKEFSINDITPAISIWFGQKDVFFAETQVMADYYQMGRPGFFGVGFGSGLGKVDRSMLRADLYIELDDTWWGNGKSYVTGVNFAGNIWINDRVTLKTSVFVGSTFGCSGGLQVHMGNDRWKARR